MIAVASAGNNYLFHI